ncbi:hypothetical protein BKA69DRAFT_1103644 [Paraphysoderma sedebokerense]|nr:hypothetical protein BKA69DRAFT_1103644 [Paraphysoderma sedebokerense]
MSFSDLLLRQFYSNIAESKNSTLLGDQEKLIPAFSNSLVTAGPKHDASTKITIDRILTNRKLRGVLYRSWSQVVRRIDSNSSASNNVLVKALSWLRSNWDEYPIKDPTEFFSRLCVFSTVKSVWTRSKTGNDLREALDDVIGMESLGDLLITMMVDTSSLLVMNENGTIQEFQYLIQTVISLPFQMPLHRDLDRLRRLIKSETSRSDAYACIIFHLESIVSTLADNPKLNKSLRPGDVTSIFGPQEAKLCFMLNQLRDLINMAEPSHVICELLQKCVESVAQSPITQTSPALQQSCMAKHLLSLKRGPPYSIYPLQAPYFMNVLNRQTSETSTTFLSDNLAGSEATKQKDVKFQSLPKFINNIIQNDESVALLEGVWVQIDSDMDRIVMPALQNSQDHVFEVGYHILPMSNGERSNVVLDCQETLISSSAGILDMSYNGLTWYGIDRESDTEGILELHKGISIYYPNIVRFSLGRVTDASTLPYTSNKGLNLPVLESRIAKTPRDNSNSSSKAFYLSIYTNDDVYKFYPFFEEEIYKVVDCISTATGLSPFRESMLVKFILARKLEITRRLVLYSLLQRENPWIEHSGDLIQVIKNLTMEHEPQTVYDMEKLFHSCRLESEVTKEAIYHLRVTWHNSQSETVRLKVLGILDRLLDRAIMREGDSNFVTVSKWLRQLEDNISPYKSADALKLVLILLKRVNSMQIEPLTPLHQFQTDFDYLGEYSRFFRLFTGGDIGI